MDTRVMLSFVDECGDQLFSASGFSIPRAGDTVCYSMEATDRHKWADDAWADRHEVSGREWVVLRVHHDFRRMGVDRPETQVLFVYVRPAD